MATLSGLHHGSQGGPLPLPLPYHGQGCPAFAGHLSIPEVPAPSVLLSSPRGMDVSSLALVGIPIQLGWLGLLW